MIRKFTMLILFTVISAGTLFAQDKFSEPSGKTPNIISSSRGDLLWDNLLPASTNGIISSMYGGLTAPNNIVQCAEDFTVPSGTIWNISEILATGFYSAGSENASSFGIDFFENNAGAPGNLIETRSIANPGIDPVQGTFSTVSLGEGTYWVSFYAIHDTSTALATFRWNWYASDLPNQIGAEPYIRDLAGFFGGLPWTPFSGLSLAYGAMLFQLFGEAVVPVELTSFTASVVDKSVSLSWQTASETNNYGFEVERAINNSNFITIGFVEGNGTTTEVKNYSYSDKNISSGTYTYRLKQVDFDGKFEYSNEVEVDFTSAPTSYSLNQNFPNPFNPGTKISFTLPVESHLTLKIFNLLGEEVANLVNGTLEAGSHDLDFNASSLNSGVYFYSIEAQGTDGSSFSEVKKMMLTK